MCQRLIFLFLFFDFMFFFFFFLVSTRGFALADPSTVDRVLLQSFCARHVCMRRRIHVI